MSTRRAPTLRGRVSTLALGVIAGWLIVLAGGFDIVLSVRLDQQVEDALRVRTQAATATVEVRGGRIVGVRESATDAALDSSIWVYAGTRVIEHPDVEPDVQRAADALAGSGRRLVDRAGRRFMVLPVRAGGRRIGSVVAAIELEPYHRTRDLAIIGSVVVAVLLLGGAYPVLRYATGRALRPVEQMTQQAAEWSATSPGERFGADQRYAELSSLAHTLDELLDRLSALLRHERHLSAELSHELRTPLSRVVAQLDLMHDSASDEQRAELAAVQENCAAMDRIIDTLLSAARAEFAPTVGRCELGPLLASVVASLGDPGDVVVTAAATDLAVGVDPAIVTRTIGPILDNAVRFARSRIDLRAERAGGAVAVEIANDGPVLPADYAERVFDPGFRGDPADGPAGVDAHDGAGLGLALARRLARSSDGDLTVQEKDGRTTFRLVLPAG